MDMKRIFRTSILCLSLLGTPALHADVTEILRERMEWLMHQQELEIEGEPILARVLLPAVYEANGYEPLWESRSRLEQLEDVVKFAFDQGLDPGDYPIPALLNLLPDSGLPTDPAQRADLDILATEMLVRVAYQVRFGKVNPYQLFADWNFDRELLPGADPVEEVLGLIKSGDMRRGATKAIARGPIYAATVTALAEYRAIADAGGWPEVPEGPVLREGDTDGRVPILRQRLIVSGDLEAGGDASSAAFDADLSEGIVRFQARHGLDADGVVGRNTLRALNVPVEARIDQIKASLERGRWVFEDLLNISEMLVLVNIASAEVSLVRGREIVWNTRAQIGKPYRQTPVFKDEIEYLVFNPTWTVPPTILRNDTLPRLMADPTGYLAEKNMDLLDRDGRVVSVDDVDWDQVGPGRFPYIVRQRPGPWNALGMVKFIFPNPHFVFLHDTPSRELFDREGRAFSSGCVRVEEPFVLAEKLFDEPRKWNQESFQEILDSGETKTVRLEKEIPVFLMYLTAEVDGKGGIRFFDDIYGRDETLIKALKAPPQFEAIN